MIYKRIFAWILGQAFARILRRILKEISWRILKEISWRILKEISRRILGRISRRILGRISRSILKSIFARILRKTPMQTSSGKHQYKYPQENTNASILRKTPMQGSSFCLTKRHCTLYTVSLYRLQNDRWKKNFPYWPKTLSLIDFVWWWSIVYRVQPKIMQQNSSLYCKQMH